MCPHCMRAFVLENRFNSHVQGCSDAMKLKTDLRKKIPFRPASEIANDSVHSAASLGIGEGVEVGGVPNKALYFPNEWQMQTLCTSVIVPQGWARKCVGRKVNRFTDTQIDFLRSMFDSHHDGGHKVREAEALEEKKRKFTHKSPGDPFSKTLVLTVNQIKSWFSQEARRRKVQAERSVIERMVTELTVAQDLPVDAVDDQVIDRAVRGAEVEREEGGLAGHHSIAQAGENQERLGQQVDRSKCVLYIVVQEKWMDQEWFEVWELEGDAFDGDVLADNLMIRNHWGRKWVHDSTLLDKGQPTEPPTDLPDKPPGGGKLGKKGQRRFAPSQNRRWKDFRLIEPSTFGHIWLKIHIEELEQYQGRDSFVFTNQVPTVKRAYKILNSLIHDEEQGQEE